MSKKALKTKKRAKKEASLKAPMRSKSNETKEVTPKSFGNLIIVESPTKARTIQKYLKGQGYGVMATVGHIKDLPKSKLGVEIENDFKPTYENLSGKKKIFSELKMAAKTAKEIFLAPDPDREGEAIAYHVSEILSKNGTKGHAPSLHRVLFHEITKNAILDALKNPRDIDIHLFDAHKARRVLDRLVGYKISPLLWEKVRRGLSAGRVQSVAVRMICDRENEIRAFVSEEYWQITALFANQKKEEIEAKLFKIGKEKAEIGNEARAKEIIEDLQNEKFFVDNVEKKERKNNPAPPFITSKLQQDAANKLGFTAKKTMVLAQQLYEGMDLGSMGSTGLITYMRTDSVRVSDESVSQARSFISSRYGKEHVPEKPNFYKNKKQAQDAHEAIRPTSLEFEPKRVKKYLDKDQYRLYELIWNRFLASQMRPAIFDRTTLDIKAKDYLFRANGSVLKYPGYLLVYDVGTTKNKSEEKILPLVEKGDELQPLSLVPSQHFTQPPPRYTESSLVKALEENGIGRPSTYASIMGTILQKDYVRKDAGKFFPTELGMQVTKLLVDSFPDILNVEFTANMEDQLDKIEAGDSHWVEILKNFYKPFKADLDTAKVEMKNLKTQEIETDIVCEKCNSSMVIKWGRNGEFIACTSYPDCRNTKEFKRGELGKIIIVEDEDSGETCEKCGKPMKIKRGRYGSFVACSGYPDCKNTKALSTGVKCPEKGCKGEIAVRYSRRGKVFYSCNQYPKCKFAIWDKPIDEPCPVCQAPFLVEKYTKKSGPMVKCLKGDYERSLSDA